MPFFHSLILAPLELRRFSAGQDASISSSKASPHISHDLQLLIDSGDADALAALSDHTADTDGWDDEFLPGYASGASDDGDLF